MKTNCQYEGGERFITHFKLKLGQFARLYNSTAEALEAVRWVGQRGQRCRRQEARLGNVALNAIIHTRI